MLSEIGPQCSPRTHQDRRAKLVLATLIAQQHGRAAQIDAHGRFSAAICRVGSIASVWAYRELNETNTGSGHSPICPRRHPCRPLCGLGANVAQAAA